MSQALRIRRRLETAIEGLRKLQGRRSRFSDTWAYFVGGREILHFHSEREIDLRLTRRAIRAERQALEADPRVDVGRRERDWIVVRLGAEADVPFVLELVRKAIRANRAS